MNQLLKEINRIRKTEISNKVKNRLKEFESFKDKSEREWFSELSFCLLTANSKARTAIQIQNELGPSGFCEAKEEEIRDCIIKNKHRFHNNKARFIVLAREYLHIKKIILEIVEKEGEVAAREWLVKNIKGLGFKEASHFLRNVGYKNLAILDRHVLNLLVENSYLKEKPKHLTRKTYLEYERILESVCNEVKMSQAELDLYLWYIKGGDVLK